MSRSTTGRCPSASRQCRGRAAAAHDEYPHRRGRRRLRARLRGGRLLSVRSRRAPAPGPACYRNGGPLTVTDVQVLLGRIAPENFPAIFGRGGRSARPGSRRRFDSLAAPLPRRRATPRQSPQVSRRRGRIHGPRDPPRVGSRRPRSGRLRAPVLRRRGAPARLPRRRSLGIARGPDPSARRRPLRLGHRPCRPPPRAAPEPERPLLAGNLRTWTHLSRLPRRSSRR